MNERRAAQSDNAFLKPGTIEFDGSGGVDCTIRNISPDGATLDVASPIGIPHEITLNIASSHEMSELSYRLAQGKTDRRGLRPLERAEEFHDRPNKNSLFQVQQVFQREGTTTHGNGYQVQCPHCMNLITFDSSSEDPNIRRPLKAARDFRIAAEEAITLARMAAQGPKRDPVY